MSHVHSAVMATGKQIQTTLRVPEEWADRIDAIAKAMSRPGNDATRVEALRYLIERGFEPAEHELGIKPAAKTKR